MTAEFERCIAVTLREEDPSGLGKVTTDAGGVTRWGIASRYHAGVDVASLSLEGAKAIYREKYWNPLRCVEMKAPLGMLVFDAAVNPGPSWAARTLQTILHARWLDGIVGMETLQLARTADVETYVEFTNRRYERFESSPDAAKYIRGWRRRCFRVLYQAARMEQE